MRGESQNQANEINWNSEVEKLLKANDGFINICYEALDRHLSTDTKHKTALRFITKRWPLHKDSIEEYTYQELFEKSCRFANVLKSLKVKKSDVVFTLLPRLPELYFSFYGSLRLGAVVSPLFSVFGPEPVKSRLLKGQVKVLVTLSSYYKKKIEPIRKDIPSLQHLILINDDGNVKNIPDALDFAELMLSASHEPFLEKTSAEDTALLHFTSGTTGEPKAAVHVHAAVVYHKISAKLALDLKKEDMFWCTADPGWITGTSYGIIAPLANEVTLLIDEIDFQADRWYRLLQDFKVNVWYTAPTALRMLMKAGEELPTYFNFKSVRMASSVGEPLNPEVISWTEKHMKILLHDNWWQTETGGIMIANSPSLKVKPGSMGQPLPGIEVRLARRTEKNELKFIEDFNQDGEIVIRKGWPSQFRNYLGQEERYNKCFVGDWYLSGDLARLDHEGYFWFIGRADDVIKSAGHLIGPFEVESALMEHEAVLESAVIGIPDPLIGEEVKAYVVLKSDYTESADLRSDILAFARKRLGVSVAPRTIAFIENLPKTKSGKIMRRLLKAHELGLPEGDTSTLEVQM